ncbi:MAG: hypothetical protein ABIH92_03380 [Nanoarchaeota archaeon]
MLGEGSRIRYAFRHANSMFRERIKRAKKEVSSDRAEGYLFLAYAAYPIDLAIGSVARRDSSQDSPTLRHH